MAMVTEAWVRVHWEDFLYASLYLTMELGDQLASPYSMRRSTITLGDNVVQETILEKKVSDEVVLQGFTRTTKKERLFFMSANAFSFYSAFREDALKIDYEKDHEVLMGMLVENIKTGRISRGY